MFQSVINLMVFVAVFDGYSCLQGYLRHTLHVTDMYRYPKNITFTIHQTNNHGTIFLSAYDDKYFLNISLFKDIQKRTWISFVLNSSKKKRPWETFCPQRNVARTGLHFRIYRINHHLHISCNGGETIVLFEGNESSFSASVDIYVGNSVDNLHEHQLYGCLKEFKYNDAVIPFIGQNSTFLSLCEERCFDDPCSSIECYKLYETLPNCNCESTSKTGIFCNQTSILSPSPYSWDNNQHFSHISLEWLSNITNIVLMEAVTSSGTWKIFLDNSNNIQLINTNTSEIHCICTIKNDSFSNHIYIKTFDDAYILKCNEDGEEKRFSINKRIDQKVNTGFTKSTGNTGYCTCYIGLFYREPRNETKTPYRDTTLVYKSLMDVVVDANENRMNHATESVRIFDTNLLKGIALIVTCAFVIIILFGAIKLITQRKNTRLEAPTPGHQKEDPDLKFDEKAVRQPSIDENQLYDALVYDQTDTLNCPIEDAEYTSMRPTLPSRNCIQVKSDTNNVYFSV